MSECSGWKALDIETRATKLLVKLELHDDGYDISLTDLSRIWGERLTMKEVFERAHRQRCSIDPSEEGQYSIFMAKIDSALRREESTTLDLHSTTHGLQLRLTAPLPESLPVFCWNFDLSMLSDATIGSELVIPLLLQANRLQRQVGQLLDEISHKDIVISKITDRFVASGNGLDAIFPGVSNVKINKKGRKSQREQLAGHILGLGEFDLERWRVSTFQGNELEHFGSSDWNVALENLPLQHDEKKASITSEEWWRELEKVQPETEQTPSETLTRRPQFPSFDEIQCTPVSGTDSDETDACNLSGTGEQAHAVSSNQDEVWQWDEDDDDDDDLDAAPSQKSAQGSGRTAQQKTTRRATEASGQRKLGFFGGKKPESHLSSYAALSNVGLGSTSAKSSSGHPGIYNVGEGKGAAMETLPAKRKLKIGAFGGKKKDDHAQTPTSKEPSSAPAMSKGELEKSAKSSEKKDVERKEVIESGINPAEEELPRQDEENGKEYAGDQADRKRQMLKRELEEKSKTSSKKKRRF